MNSPQRQIIINLERSREAASFVNEEGYTDKKYLIQQDAVDKFASLINEILGRIDVFHENQAEDSPTYMRTHDVITVDGKRGSGKTTFILNAYSTLDKSVRDKILFVGVIDPTLIETREHVFVTIVSHIKREVDKWYARSQGRNAPRKYEEWRRSLRELAGGMTLLDGVGQNHMQSDEWMDEHFAMEHGLRKARSGGTLERAFHAFINKSLTLLDRKAFLIAFDDIDTDFSKGWPVLELLRKYMTTPQLITVLSGDLNLYSTLVEKQQWATLGLDFSKSQDASDRHKEMVEELVDQYLLKILRTPNRIELKTIWDCVSDKRTLVTVAKKNSEKNRTLHNIMHKFCESVLRIAQRGQRERAISFLLQLPPRTVMSLLFVIDKVSSSSWDVDTTDNVLVELGDVFYVWLQKYEYTRSHLAQLDSQVVMSKLLKIYENQNSENGRFSLVPSFVNLHESNVLMLIGAHISYVASYSKTFYFDYLIRLLLTSTFLKNNKDGVSFALYKRHAELEVADPAQIVRCYLSAAYPEGWSKSGLALQHGTLQLYSDSTKTFREMRKSSAGKLDPVVTFNSAGSLFVNITSWHRYIAMLPISVVRNRDSSFTHFSIFNILGQLASLMCHDDLHTQLKQAGSIKRAAAVSIKQYEDIDEEDFFTDIEEDFSLLGLASFEKAFKKWMRCDLLKYPTHIELLSRAWDKFFVAVKTLPSSFKDDGQLAGAILHRWLVMFLNAVLVEEARSVTRGRLKENNPITEDKIFEDNLLVLSQPSQSPFHAKMSLIEMKKVPFFEWLFACPLWTHYLEQGSLVFMKHCDIMSNFELYESSDALEQAIEVQYRYASDNESQNEKSTYYYLNSLASVGLDTENKDVELHKYTQYKMLTSNCTNKFLSTLESDYGLSNVNDKSDLDLFIKKLKGHMKNAFVIKGLAQEVKSFWKKAECPLETDELFKFIRSLLIGLGSNYSYELVIPNNKNTQGYQQYILPAFLTYVVKPYLNDKGIEV
ncbi:hypothetical protein [Halodesulfovibrio sp.]|uniref:hypothetical protein n=1 Tax=Halodesulfovibrio sp. TaxID=1912772 RepID=UPI0025BAC9D8|nr:hypothetical protein [Halodesulfovibrio sp.]